MIKLICSVMLISLLYGCGYDQSEVIAAKAACDAQSGQVKLSTTADGVIMADYCTVDSIQYRIGRSGQGFYDATLVK